MKPRLPKGTRDFTPIQVRKRNYLFEVIKSTFEIFGYQPIETPAMENLSTLMGKYGDEGDQLLFKVLNNGDFLSKADKEALSNLDSNALIPSISKRGLRYDLTVPFARFLSMNRNDLTLPFKRYQIQAVWRADRPQKGRFQEFYQCDADVAGSTSLAFESEFIEIYDRVFSKLNLPVKIRINHRKLLQAVAQVGGMEKDFSTFTTILDKWDKTGEEGFVRDLLELGHEKTDIENVTAILTAGFKDENTRKKLMNSNVGQTAVEEIEEILKLVNEKDLGNDLEVDLTLARGLNYYTGCVMEIEGKDQSLGSLGGGGRYDDLTGIFNFPDISGVGISFGAERIFEILEEKDLFPQLRPTSTKILFMVFDSESLKIAKEWCSFLRDHNIPCEFYPEPAKLKKQFKYAENLNLPYVALVGERELQINKVAVKNQKSGEQEDYSKEELLSLLRE